MSWCRTANELLILCSMKIYIDSYRYIHTYIHTYIHAYIHIYI